jgi:hypothetical protein
MDPVGIFQPVDELPGRPVEARDGPRPIIGGRVRDRGGREQAGAVIGRERRAEPLAIGPPDRPEAAPAPGAQAAAVGDGLRAGEALRRRAKSSTTLAATPRAREALAMTGLAKAIATGLALD